MRLPVSGGLPLNATCTRFLAQKLDGASRFSEGKGANPRPKKEKSHLSVHLSRGAFAIGPNADHVIAFSPPSLPHSRSASSTTLQHTHTDLH
ncbi:hypothetical protein TNCV_2110131 [Trichonephila clavipes]|nr:hypothetical protein TNCV_2110131 [Trichonephila clavipes]